MNTQKNNYRPAKDSDTKCIHCIHYHVKSPVISLACHTVNSQDHTCDLAKKLEFPEPEDSELETPDGSGSKRA